MKKEKKKLEIFEVSIIQAFYIETKYIHQLLNMFLQEDFNLRKFKFFIASFNSLFDIRTSTFYLDKFYNKKEKIDYFGFISLTTNKSAYSNENTNHLKIKDHTEATSFNINKEKNLIKINTENSNQIDFFRERHQFLSVIFCIKKMKNKNLRRNDIVKHIFDFYSTFHKRNLYFKTIEGSIYIDKSFNLSDNFVFIK